MTANARRSWRTLACALPVLLVACGGGGDGGSAPLSCTVADQQARLRSYMNDWYFWYALAPNPSPAGFASVATYFDALIYSGGDLIPDDVTGARWPADRYSGFQSTESFNRFFGEGRTLGYGVAVAGLEVTEPTPLPNQPLYVRYVEPLSPAAAAGVVRGDRVMSINGVVAASLISAKDFSALTPNAVGQQLTLVLRNALGADRPVTLVAATFGLTPVQNAQILQTFNGRSLGYVAVKDMISQAAAPLATAFANFKARNVQELVLDLRYNGGGLVSMGGTVASYAAGSRGNGQLFARLLYNDKRSANNQDFIFANPAAWTGFSKVYVLAGPRTCSASEQVINGLRGVGVNVVAIGDTSCGKPVGFLPSDTDDDPHSGCGTTYSVVNFESVNARNEGRYFDGFQATCAVAEDFTRPIGDTSDSLLVAAAYHADNGACPAGTAAREQAQSRLAAPRARYSGADGGERTGMSAR
ncbi:MAG: S41 family peptidase [Burkholderiaceae bacterium]|nr:S41 family peptidase [Burkholderiaceae bacterium]